MKAAIIVYGKYITIDGKKVYRKGYGAVTANIGKSLHLIRKKVAVMEKGKLEEISIETINGESIESLQKIGLITA